MAVEIAFENDVTQAQSRAKGSDGRLNVSSRTDSRAYYNSRDQQQTYSIIFNHPASAVNEYTLYIKNTSTTKDMVISAMGLNSDLGADVKLFFVSGTAANGASVTPTNLNRDSSNDALADVLEDGGGTAISGLTNEAAIDYVKISEDGHEELRLDDRVRLGQNDAVAIQVVAVKSGTPQVFGVAFCYFES